MKKFIVFLACVCVVIANFCMHSQYETLASSNFGRIENSTNIYMTTTPSDDFSNIYCIAEKSYFVEILSDIEQANLYKVRYNGVTGFVKKSDIKKIKNTPTNPYPYNIKLVVGSNCNLRSTPTTKSTYSNILDTIYSGEDQIAFIGRIFSEEAIDFGGSVWYYVSFNGKSGYVYNKYIKSITPIYENTEPFEYATSDLSRTSNPITDAPSIIIILILLLPCIAILLILYLPRKSKKPRPKKSPKIFDKY